MNELALFAGAGGGILGGHLLGWRTVCAVEHNAYARSVLLARQNDGTLPPFPIWDDVRTFDGRSWRGAVDVVSGGFPCQDISAAGAGAGIDGERSGLWAQMARIVGEVRPRFVFVENSPMLTSRGLGRVLGDLAEMGFDAEWGVVSAADTGAPHLRERIWIVADARCGRCGESGEGEVEQPWRAEAVRAGVGLADTDGPWEQQQAKRGDGAGMGLVIGSQDVADTNRRERPFRRIASGVGRLGVAEKDARNDDSRGNDWPAEPDVGRVANGVAARVDRLKAIGNGQVPRVAAAAFDLLSR